MPELGFCGPSYVARSIYQDDEECINWFVEPHPGKSGGDKSPPERGFWTLYPTPGLIESLQLPLSKEVRGLWPRSDLMALYAACGSKLYEISTAWVATEIGTLNSTTGPVSLTDNGVSLYFCDGTDRYYYTWGTGTFAVVSDGAFQGADRVDVVDNFIVYNHPGTNEWGATSALSVVSPALSFSTKDSTPDNINTLIVDHREVFILGTVASERWINTGQVPFPFERIPGTSMQHGCIAPSSIAYLGESTVFLSRDTRGTSTVVQMNGYTPRRISTFAVEYAINNYNVVTDAIGFTYTQSGHEFYVLTFPTQNVTWVYDLASSLWHKRASRTNSNILNRYRANCFALFNNQIIVGDFQNGKLYRVSETAYDDNGDTIIRLRRTRHLTNDLKNQFFSSIQIQFQPGVGLQMGQGSDPEAMLTWSDDGGSTWNTQRRMKIGKVGKYKNRCIFRRCGYGRDRIWELTVTDPINAVVVSSELVSSVGGS